MIYSYGWNRVRKSIVLAVSVPLKKEQAIFTITKEVILSNVKQLVISRRGTNCIINNKGVVKSNE